MDVEQLLTNSDFIIIAGGHVPTLNTFFQDINLKALIHQYQATIMRISDGLMNAASVVYAQPEAVAPNDKRYLQSLDLTKCQILPHYNLMKDAELDGKRVYEDITFSDSYGHQFNLLPDGSYIFSENRIETLYAVRKRY